jgi:hypothetical protein
MRAGQVWKVSEAIGEKGSGLGGGWLAPYLKSYLLKGDLARVAMGKVAGAVS